MFWALQFALIGLFLIVDHWNAVKDENWSPCSWDLRVMPSEVEGCAQVKLN